MIRSATKEEIENLPEFDGAYSVGGTEYLIRFARAVEKVAHKEMRHACAEALAEVLSTGDKTTIMCAASQAVMNAKV